MQEISRIPVLRFSEFSDKLKSMTMQDYHVSSAFGPRFSSSLYSEEGNVVTLRTTDMDENGTISYDFAPRANIDFEKIEDHLLKKGDLVISRSGTVGITGLFDGYRLPVIPGAFLIRIRLKTNVLYPKYVQYFLNSTKGRHSINKVAAGGVQKNVTSGNLLNVNLNIPTICEQQKIVSFLTTIDKKIAQVTKKKTLLEQYKKGVMQQLFGQEMRFKDDDGKDYPDWEIKRLGQICHKSQSGGTPKSTRKEFYNGKIPFLAISDMTAQGKYLTGTSKSISELGLDSSSSWLVPKNSLIYSMYASVGFVSINKIELATSQAVMNIILKDSVLVEYVYYFLLDFQKHIARFVETGTQGNINASIVKNINIKVPVYEEQKKIADFLSAIDDKITFLDEQIQKTKVFKKGLLQQMFV